MISNNHFKVLKTYIFAGKYLPPLLEIFLQKIPIQNILTITFLLFCDKLNAHLCQEIVLDKFKQLQNICEKPLSHTRNYTLTSRHSF